MMYIPYEMIWFLLGFAAFPIFAYGIYEFILKKKEQKKEIKEEEKPKETKKELKKKLHKMFED